MTPSHRSDLPLMAESAQRAFFDAARAATMAAIGDKPVTRDVQLLGKRIRLAFGSESLCNLLFGALSHLEMPVAGAADAHFFIWAGDEGDIAMPPAPVGRHCFSDRGDIWTMHSRDILSAFHWSEFSLALYDAPGAEGIYWLRSSQSLPYWTQASPLRTLLHWWARAQGAQLVHAAVVGNAQGGLMITGRGGVGKSTTALGALNAGMAYVGDDYVLLASDEDGQYHAHSLYCTAKLNPDNLADFAHFNPQFLGGGGADGGEKAVIFLGNCTTKSLPLRGVITPQIADGTAQFCVIDRAEMIGAASFTTMAQLPHAGEATAAFIANVLRALPLARLMLGDDRAAIPPMLSDFIAAPRDLGRDAPFADDCPLLSVIIPCYNGADFLADAIGSVLAQQYPKLEIIVVDDGSTDDLASAIAALPVEVRLLSIANAGPAAARNMGLRAAMGSLIGFIDVDDIWPVGKLAASLARLDQSPEADVVIGHAQLMEVERDGKFGFVGSPAEGFVYYIGAGLYRARAFASNGVFDARLRYGEDLDWFARAERNRLNVARMDMVTLHVRRHAGNMTRGMDGAALNPLQLARNALLAKRQGAAG
ncbi:MAG: glycosyltransferase [Sphingomonadaceae bacterium]|nr:glycosyltransferase [Sphingomonadaceae bacterium]